MVSSRVGLKQANVRCQTLLESWAEPLAVLAAPMGYDGGDASLALAWRYLLLNHPHDSLCGCSLVKKAAWRSSHCGANEWVQIDEHYQS